MLNVVAIMGRLTADPELKTTQQGTYCTRFTIACDRSYSKGEKQADFITVTAWRQTAEFICKYFNKGSLIAIDGSIQTNQYKDKNGNNRTSFEILAKNVNFAGGKSGEKTRSFDEQTQDYQQQAQQPQGYAQGSDDDFSLIDDNDDLPF